MFRLRICGVVLALWVVSAVAALGGIISNVVETGGDNEATDTITAKWTGQTWKVTVADEPIPDAVVGDDYTAGLFGHRAPAFVDRSHRYLDDSATSLLLPAYLVGNEYILSGNDNRDNASYVLDVTVSSPARVYMLIDNRLSDGDAATPPSFDATHMQWIIDEGWAATANGWNRAADPLTPDEVAFDEGADDTVDQYYSVYTKDFSAGTFQLWQADNAGRNMYGVVVAPVPEPATWVLALCGLMGLFAVGRFCRR